MTMQMTKEIYEALKGIRESFLDDLVVYVGEMEEYCKYLGDPEHALKAVAGLQGIVHKISGIAGSVGFPELGKEAGQLDVAFGHIVGAPYDAAAIDTIRAPLEAFLYSLEDAFDETILPSEQGRA